MALEGDDGVYDLLSNENDRLLILVVSGNSQCRQLELVKFSWAPLAATIERDR